MAVRTPALSALGALLLLLAALRPAAAQEIVEMSFEGFGPAGLHVLTTHTTVEESAARYKIHGDFSTAGLGALFASVANRSDAEGKEDADKPHPVSFASETDRDGAVQHLKVQYPPDGIPTGSVTPAPTEPVTPIDPRQLAGTVDNLTAYWMLERQLAQSGSCALKVPVYDGRHRYDLQFSDAGKHYLSPADGQNFSGQTQACHMERQDIGGFYVNKSHEEGAKSGTFWYAPLLPGRLAVPVRMEMKTEIGNVSLLLSQLRGRGVNLKLMD